MKKSLSLLLGASLLFIMTGCDKKEEMQESKTTYKLSTAEVYEQMCAKCHGQNGEGNTEKKGPALNDQTIQELRLGITDIKMGGSGGHSSGTEHEVMEHNMKKIIEKGMDYDTDAMAQYIHDNFNKK
ncbi:MAG: c-type cytochrome [Sulfurovaceae bacterium]|nr:c-type cytochrome [Sulfurovaceae bacterium]